MSPNAENVIPGQVDISVEFRDENLDRINDAGNRFKGICRETALHRDIDIDVEEIGLASPIPMNSRVREIIQEVSVSLGLKTAPLPAALGTTPSPWLRLPRWE